MTSSPSPKADQTGSERPTVGPAPALSSAQRKALRAQAHHIDPVVMIGDSGLSPAVIAETDRALSVHELIKVRVLGDDRQARADIFAALCAALGCAPVQSIGKLLVVWRPAPAAAAPAEFIPKKLAATGATKARKAVKPGKRSVPPPGVAPEPRKRTASKSASSAEPRKRTAAKPFASTEPGRRAAAKPFAPAAPGRRPAAEPFAPSEPGRRPAAKPFAPSAPGRRPSGKRPLTGKVPATSTGSARPGFGKPAGGRPGSRGPAARPRAAAPRGPRTRSR